ncbi:uncharacterized protein V1513DRAFT_437405 [Lipomyces chichibuensis]|uniref:uncharacterized protein n=1 Tax=Lipomyces chichibuensis TaxID=1546026 RepID=UPI0033438512
MNHTYGTVIAAADVNDHLDVWLPAMSLASKRDPEQMPKSPETVRQDIEDIITIIVLILEIVYYVYQIYKAQKVSSGSKLANYRNREFAHSATGFGALLSYYEISPIIATKSELVSLMYEQPVFKDLYLVSDSGFAQLASKYPEAMQIAVDCARSGEFFETPNLVAVVRMLDGMFNSSGICPYIRAMKEGSLDQFGESANTGLTVSTSQKILRSLKAIDFSPTYMKQANNEDVGTESFLVVVSTVALKLDAC